MLSPSVLFLPGPSTRLHRHYHKAGLPILLRHCSAPQWWFRNFRLIPIAYAFRPRLRVPTNPARMSLGLGNLGLSANGFFTRFIATHVSIITSDTSSRPRRSTFAGVQNAPLPMHKMHPTASVPCLAPLNFRRSISRPVSYYAFF